MRDLVVAIFLLSYLNIIGGFSLLVDQFVHKKNVTKCCETGEILWRVSDNSSYQCILDLKPTSVLEIPEVLPKELFGKTSCVDIVQDSKYGLRKLLEIDGNSTVLTHLDLHPFPKCCPLNWVYNTQNHQCINVNSTLETDITTQIKSVVQFNKTIHIQYGMEKCDTVIVDYELSSLDFDANLGLYLEKLNETISYGSYCIDNSHNKQTYVVRVCHKDFSICKKKKTDTDKLACIRKCCRDGNSYQSGAACSYDYTHGFNFANTTTTLDFEDPYAVIPGNSCRKYLADENYPVTLNKAGSIVLTPTEQPSKFFSPFKPTYCFEYVSLPTRNGLQLFLCFQISPKD